MPQYGCSLTRIFPCDGGMTGEISILAYFALCASTTLMMIWSSNYKIVLLLLHFIYQFLYLSIYVLFVYMPCIYMWYSFWGWGFWIPYGELARVDIPTHGFMFTVLLAERWDVISGLQDQVTTKLKSLPRDAVITNNHASFHLWWKGNLLNHQKVPEYYELDCGFTLQPLLYR